MVYEKDLKVVNGDKCGTIYRDHLALLVVPWTFDLLGFAIGDTKTATNYVPLKDEVGDLDLTKT